MNKEEFWIAKDKCGTIHFANVKLVKPSELYPDNPDANDEIFIPEYTGYLSNGSPVFSITLKGQLPIPENLTFENSPKRIRALIIE